MYKSIVYLYQRWYYQSSLCISLSLNFEIPPLPCTKTLNVAQLELRSCSKTMEDISGRLVIFKKKKEKEITINTHLQYFSYIIAISVAVISTLAFVLLYSSRQPHTPPHPPPAFPPPPPSVADNNNRTILIARRYNYHFSFFSFFLFYFTIFQIKTEKEFIAGIHTTFPNNS